MCSFKEKKNPSRLPEIKSEKPGCCAGIGLSLDCHQFPESKGCVGRAGICLLSGKGHQSSTRQAAEATSVVAWSCSMFLILKGLLCGLGKTGLSVNTPGRGGSAPSLPRSQETSSPPRIPDSDDTQLSGSSLGKEKFKKHPEWELSLGRGSADSGPVPAPGTREETVHGRQTVSFGSRAGAGVTAAAGQSSSDTT